MDSDKIIFHIDVNSAYLSWTAVSKIQKGEEIDIRNIPSVVGGDISNRHGIVLAKSILAKKYKINTGEPLFKAMGKCPELKVYKPNYELYIRCSDGMVKLLKEYSPKIQRYSVDECFLDVTHAKNNYYEKAKEISERIKDELGFTVNIGISNNKLLAKMASDFQKPDRIHTLFPSEIKKKMWPLPVEDLFMVGKQTALKLKKLNIYTIGDLANYDFEILTNVFKSHGRVIYEYANGIDRSEVRDKNYLEIKGIGNSTTISYDVDNKEDAYKILLSLTENVAMRLRNSKNICNLVSVSIKNKEFKTYSHQRKLNIPTDCTKIIYKEIKCAFDYCWKGEGIRQLGVRVSDFCDKDFYQGSLFEEKDIDKSRKLDEVMDDIRKRFGNNSVLRSTFINSGLNPLISGNGEVDYPFMGSVL
ncbi:Y-family DNA polymerase [Clostridium cibarium]|uniref:DNA polymerase IV n=1 Tax=Clostridium cibarium TaxID=2762247 RepID=A0ABR8PPR5_9CLOT|nr:DNA polymerase IV [Clostridium cibarium]MBD7910169.1 DNA polymerase IV [Clostridium cibarium]